MDFILAPNRSEYQIQSYEPRRLIVNGQAYTTSVLVSNLGLNSWRPQTLADVTQGDLEELLALKADVILLGVGPVMRFLSPPLQRFIAENAVPLEVMTTKAAVRTFHVLSAEARKVYAALLLT